MSVSGTHALGLRDGLGVERAQTEFLQGLGLRVRV